MFHFYENYGENQEIFEQIFREHLADLAVVQVVG
jgi:hypothetical protein